MTARWPLIALALSACAPDPAPTGAPAGDEWDDKLADRVVDYNAALRIAALRLTGELPTLQELTAVASAASPQVAYESQIEAYLASPKFARQMFSFWQDTMKMGGAPLLDAAPAFAAELTVTNQPFTALFTATSGTCPTFDPTTNTFAPGTCAGAAQVAATGVLTDAGMNVQFFSNFAFRRVRWIQETFACTAFPAQMAVSGRDVGGATPYTGVFPFGSIAGHNDALGIANGGTVNFLDTSAVVCANCHSNINHIAPLFGNFDANGDYQPTIVVPTPDPNHIAVLGDYLPAGEPLAWRAGVPTPDLPSLGRAIAADPAVASCVIARMWNWALGKGDIVDGGFAVPAETIAEQVTAFTQGGYHLKSALLAIFTSDDFVRF